jgi:imidazolonepropionase-like amidohydrolase
MKDKQALLLAAGTALVLLCSAAGCSTALPAGVDATSATLALVHGTLIDGTGGEPVRDAVVLIAGDRILAVGTGRTLRVPGGVETIDLGGGTILPGFINAHVHYGFDEANLQAWAQGGVTTVRDESVMSDSESLAELMAFRDRTRADPRNARLVSYGTMITVPDGYGDIHVSSPEEARQAVLDEIAQGVDGIKVSLEDGYAGRSGLPKLTPEQLSAIVEAAHENGLRVSGHITQGAYIQQLLDAGVDDIAHLPYDYFPPEAIQQMVETGVFLTPTFTVFRSYGAPVGTCVRNLRQFVEAGGQVALGNDYGGGGSGEFELGIPMYEIGMMAQAGMTPMEIILASTLNAARAANLESEVGTLEPGKSADVLVVAGDPLDDLQSLTHILLVVHYGAVIRNEIAP